MATCCARRYVTSDGTSSTLKGTAALSAASSRAVFSGLSSISAPLPQSSLVIRRSPMIGNIPPNGSQGLVGALRDRDAQPIPHALRHVLADGDVPAADEERC